MPSPWIDLLGLHGYLTDVELLRRLASIEKVKPPAPTRDKPPHSPPMQRIVATVRLCLGIGDGLLRTQ
ncbi:hypothetical protein [Dyella sp. C11]|uniref:hypothetical protein n=1 Tax=Dyella sp. C11 TaxID=2126991 RepID=UPI000D646454|nr:hypothetical protein [Dyella sp. C11]